MYVCSKSKDKELWYFLSGTHFAYHRKKAPAILYNKSETELWYLFGKLHRDFGLPAIVYKSVVSSCFSEFYIQGQKYKIKEENGDKISYTDESCPHSIADNPSVIYKNGTKEWHCNGKLHRNFFPAVIYSNGDEEWWVDGKKHRYDGPAVTYGDKQYWFFDGEFQR
ncbi:MAG: hypothetical protein EKK64_06755 [Neisseriaceae bacterium]|nr:MAG: hypothetical protein EKK64_06755 [Neisseriaceae bacterium]